MDQAIFALLIVLIGERSYQFVRGRNGSLPVTLRVFERLEGIVTAHGKKLDAMAQDLNRLIGRVSDGRD